MFAGLLAAITGVVLCFAGRPQTARDVFFAQKIQISPGIGFNISPVISHLFGGRLAMYFDHEVP